MATEFKIEKGVPVPGRSCIYPFGEMEVGDSFEAPAEMNIRRAANAYGQRDGKKFTCRKTERKGQTMRVWRVA